MLYHLLKPLELTMITREVLISLPSRDSNNILLPNPTLGTQHANWEILASPLSGGLQWNYPTYIKPMDWIRHIIILYASEAI